jgi:hypothetical protein
MKKFLLIILFGLSLLISSSIPSIYSASRDYKSKLVYYISIDELRYVDASSNNKILQLFSSNAPADVNVSNTTIQNDVGDILSKLSSQIKGKEVTVLQGFLIDVSKEIDNKGNNGSSVIKWLNRQIGNETMSGPLAQALVFLARELAGTEDPQNNGTYHKHTYNDTKSTVASLLARGNYTLPESEDERDAKSLGFLKSISPAIIRFSNSNKLVFDGHRAAEIGQKTGLDEHQRHEIEQIIYLMIVEGYNRGANITNLASNIWSQWEKQKGSSDDWILTWLRTLAVLDTSIRNKIIDVATNMSLNGNEDKIYANIREVGPQFWS